MVRAEVMSIPHLPYTEALLHQYQQQVLFPQHQKLITRSLLSDQARTKIISLYLILWGHATHTLLSGPGT